MDTFLRGRPEARRFLEGDIEGELAARGIIALQMADEIGGLATL
jgi:hypothetical protein